MAAIPTQRNFKTLLFHLSKSYPSVLFKPADTFYWSPKDKTVYYAEDRPDAQWSLLHELSHALLEHTSYSSDFELLLLEVAAWEKANKLAKNFEISIDPEHIQDCLETYRNWLHQRSACPTCNMRGLQTSPTIYECTNCLSRWSVSMARFCRPYRRQITSK